MTEGDADTTTQTHPRIRTAGVDGMLVSFGDSLSEPANRAALAFRAAVDRAAWDGIAETATSLTSAFLRYDPLAVDRDDLADRVRALLADTHWGAAPLPRNPLAWYQPSWFQSPIWANPLSKGAANGHRAGLSQ